MVTLFGRVPKPPVVAARARAHLLQTSVTPGLLQTSVARTFVSCILYYIILYYTLLYDILSYYIILHYIIYTYTCTKNGCQGALG